MLNGEELLTVGELAQRLKVRASWIYRQTGLGRISVVKVGRYNRYILNQVLQDLQKLNSNQQHEKIQPRISLT